MPAPGPVARKVEALLARVLAHSDLEVLQVHTRHEAGRSFLTVFLDRPAGAVTLQDCERVSEELGLLLDTEDLFPRRYFLEVSSPGVNRPLTRPQHYERFSGERVRVETSASIAGRKRIIGTLLGLRDNLIVVRLPARGGDEVEIPLEQVVRARLEPELPFGKRGPAERSGR